MALDSLALAHKARYLMARQEQTGIKFDIEGAKKLVSRIETEMKEIEEQVLPQLPRRKLKQSEMANYKFPKKCYNMDGSPSALMQRFAEKHNGVIEGNELVVSGERIPIIGDTYLPADMPMDLSNQEDIKEWLLSEGWSPTLWNFKKDPNTGRSMRDESGQLIKTSPKLQDKGKLCENLEEIAGPLVKLVVRWLTLRHRLSFVTGLLSQPRLMVDGRLPSGSSGVTNTFRQKHKVVANLPKAEEGVVYGKEIRGLFIADEGMVLVGFDASALEGRVTGHYCVPMNSQALTRRGWKGYSELVIGEEILAYNPATKKKQWTPLLEKVKFDDVEVFDIKAGHHVFRATANHRWFVSYRNTLNKSYSDAVVETKDLNTCCNIIVNAPTEEYDGSEFRLASSKYGTDWVERVCKQSFNETKAWLEGFMVADGHFSNWDNATSKSAPESGRWRWTQNEGNFFDAALAATFIVHDGVVNVSERSYKRGVHNCVTLNKRPHMSLQTGYVKPAGREDVWCPRTALGSWVMRQGKFVSITGNTFKYDGGLYAKELLEGDVHSKNARIFYPSETGGLETTDPEFKKYRSVAKGGLYSLTYGCTQKKLAEVLKQPISMADELYQNFWDNNPALAQLRDAVGKYWETQGNKEFVKAIDGRLLRSRSRHSLVNLLFQSCGAIAMDIAGCYLDSWLGGLSLDEKGLPSYNYKGYKVRRVVQMHDEYIFECHPDIADEVGQLGVKSIQKAGELLKLKVPLTGEYKIGPSWADIH